jgi:hypothetical protein
VSFCPLSSDRTASESQGRSILGGSRL